MSTILEIDWHRQRACLSETPVWVRTPRPVFEVSVEGYAFQGVFMKFTMPENRSAMLKIVGMDEHMHETSEFENLTFQSSDASIATVDSTGRITSLAPNPDPTVPVVITATADGMVGEGEFPIFGTLDLFVVGTGAVSLELSAELEPIV